MFEVGDHDLVAFVQTRAAKALRDEVDRLGRAAGQHDFAAGFRIDESDDLVARALEGFRGAAAQFVYAAMYVGMVLALIARDRVNDGDRLLSGRRAIEIDQRMPVYRLMQGRKIVPPRGGGCDLCGSRHQVKSSSD